jgi:hypothetical protein
MVKYKQINRLYQDASERERWDDIVRRKRTGWLGMEEPGLHWTGVVRVRRNSIKKVKKKSMMFLFVNQVSQPFFFEMRKVKIWVWLSNLRTLEHIYPKKV